MPRKTAGPSIVVRQKVGGTYQVLQDGVQVGSVERRYHRRESRYVWDGYTTDGTRVASGFRRRADAVDIILRNRT